MDSSCIPPLLIDPSQVHAPISTSEPGSFAHNTLKVRIPRILEETIQENSFPPDILAAMQALYDEVTRGKISALYEDTNDREFWNQVTRDYIGRSWLDVPWFWAETYFYRRVLQATRYFQAGEWHLVDPYRLKKRQDLDAAPRALDIALGDLPSQAFARFERLLHYSLWGNRTDLSYNVGANIEPRSMEAERVNILVDNTLRVWEYLSSQPRSLAIIADNAGTELLHDLALIDFLLSEGLASQIVLHLKSQPFFVSDAMPDDVDASMEALRNAGALAGALATRLHSHIESRRLVLTTHWFYTTCLFYFQLPSDLYKQLASMDLGILKGDANYRRLLGDAHWDTTASFANAISYFPVPVVALRTLKAELVVGLRPGEAEQLREQDPDWLVNGRRGVIQSDL
jgi:damage control phosphatase ARMT1-like protein